MIENAFGEGRVRYLGTRLDPDALRATLLDAVHTAGVAPLLAGAPGIVEVARRAHPDAEYLFLLNHSDTETATVPVPPGGLELLSGVPAGDSYLLEPLAVAVLRYPRR